MLIISLCVRAPSLHLSHFCSSLSHRIIHSITVFLAACLYLSPASSCVSWSFIMHSHPIWFVCILPLLKCATFAIATFFFCCLFIHSYYDNKPNKAINIKKTTKYKSITEFICHWLISIRVNRVFRKFLMPLNSTHTHTHTLAGALLFLREEDRCCAQIPHSSENSL